MVLLETQYFPSISWCAAVWNTSVVKLDAAEHYQKGGLRNKCFIAGPNGIQRLSIPLLKGKHQQTPIKEVRISFDEPWQRQHWRSIQAAYGNAPYFEHYAPEIERFFVKKWTFLFDLNQEIFSWALVGKMGWKGDFTLESEYIKPGTYTLGQDFRNGKMAATPLPYPQVFQEKHGFLPGLSILDILFCCGKTGGEVLANTSIFPN
ncbi:MAG: WbqC family protein [Saprospiraceae bacterium]|nr:WbqC family protein [Saprospiraceae bacterium]